jgi:NTP pyrophosphatase (non-canonical NTP hydrolase)
MTFDQYQYEASRFHTPHDQRLAHYALGVTGEAGEVADIVKKHLFHGHPLDVEKLKLELGDVLWYVSSIALLLDVDLSAVAEANIAKLSKRYPNGFSTAASMARVDVSDTQDTQPIDLSQLARAYK